MQNCLSILPIIDKFGCDHQVRASNVSIWKSFLNKYHALSEEKVLESNKTKVIISNKTKVIISKYIQLCRLSFCCILETRWKGNIWLSQGFISELLLDYDRFDYRGGCDFWSFRSLLKMR